MAMVYEAQGRAEFDWAVAVWARQPKGHSGRVVVRLAPAWWRWGRWLGLPLPLRFGMRPTWPGAS